MAKSKQKQLAISQLKQENEVYDEYVEIPVRPMGFEEDMTVKMFPLFSPSNVAKLVNEYLEFLALCKKENVNVDQSDEGDILGYFIVKYFTDIKTTKSKKAKPVIDEVNLLKNSQLYKELMELFPKDSVGAVHNRLLDLNEAFGKLENQFKSIRQQYEELNLENRETLDAVFNNKLGDTDEIVQ